jgi:hypothetical protein
MPAFPATLQNYLNSTPANYQGLIVIERPHDAIVAGILELIRRLLVQSEILHHAGGHLIVVSQQRIRIRPPLSNP